LELAAVGALSWSSGAQCVGLHPEIPGVVSEEFGKDQTVLRFCRTTVPRRPDSQRAYDMIGNIPNSQLTHMACLGEWGRPQLRDFCLGEHVLKKRELIALLLSRAGQEPRLQPVALRFHCFPRPPTVYSL
jgi:hypothetical protein